MISFIMMAYNVENYIGEAIVELQKEKDVAWELIIVEDFSDDNTFEVARKLEESDKRITLVKNISKGKVMGTNYGYSLTQGDIIKCIDSDDILLKDFFSNYYDMQKYDAHCHPSYITNEKLNILSVYHLNPSIINKDYLFVLSNIISLPKVSWSFNRKLADKIFPMPENLPFEDVWISLLIKKHANSILTMCKPLYLYRQHSNQTFGGIINYSKGIVIFRAKRLLCLLSILENEFRVMESLDKSIFDKVKAYNEIMSQSSLSLLDVIKSNLNIKYKVKIILIKKLPYFAKNLTILKWKFDAFKN
jgi:glycosyltransferase involved in cell wall biosynthesis